MAKGTKKRINKSPSSGHRTEKNVKLVYKVDKPAFLKKKAVKQMSNVKSWKPKMTV